MLDMAPRRGGLMCFSTARRVKTSRCATARLPAGGEFGENFRLSPGTGNALLTRRGPPYLSPAGVDPLGQTGKQAMATMKCQRYQRRKR
jgi:hypothetical protein